MLKPAPSTSRIARGRAVTGVLLALVSMTAMQLGLAARVAADDGALTTMEGEPAAIADYAGNGKWLAVMIWSVNCHICKEEMPNYGDAYRGGQNPDLDVLGVSLDGRAMMPLIEDFLEQRNGTFPNLVADLGPFARQYGEMVGEGLMGTPTFLVYDRSGTLVGTQPGPMRLSSLESFIARKESEGQ